VFGAAVVAVAEVLLQLLSMLISLSSDLPAVGFHRQEKLIGHPVIQPIYQSERILSSKLAAKMRHTGGGRLLSSLAGEEFQTYDCQQS
jgi:hypothetical protein